MGLEPTISSLGGRRLIHEATRACSQCEQNAHHLGLLLVAPRWRILRAAVCVRPCSCVCACVRACACVVGSDSLQTVEAYSLKIKFGEHELYYTRTSEVLYKKKIYARTANVAMGSRIWRSWLPLPFTTRCARQPHVSDDCAGEHSIFFQFWD